MKINVNQIETWVRERKSLRARSAIQHWLKSKSDLPSKIQACNWFRRLGELKLAYRVIAPKEFKLKKAGLNVAEIRQYLWCARILNLLGASEYALQIAAFVSRALKSLRNSEDLRVLGNIYLSNFDFKNAYRFLSSAQKQDSDPQSYESRLGQVSLGDVLAGLGQFDRAVAQLKKIQVQETERLLRGILLQAEGEYLARQGEGESALGVLQRAQGYFPDDDQSLDAGFLLKWIGISKIRKGEGAAGLRDLNQAIQILGKPSHRPEMVLDCLYWKRQLGVATAEEERVLSSYPGQNLPRGRERPTPEVETLHPSSAEMVISLSREEWCWKGQANPRLPKEIELLGLLGMAVPYGLPVYRAFTLLWPDGLNSFLQLEDRLSQLQKRIRDVYGIHVFAREKNLYLAPKERRRVKVETPGAESKPWVFEVEGIVPRSQVGEFYRLKSTQVHHLIQEWLGARKVRTRKRGKETLIEYRPG